MTTVFIGINGDKATMTSDTGLTTTINGKLQTLSYKGHVVPLNDNLLLTTSGNAVLADSLVKELLATGKRLKADYVANYFIDKLENEHGQNKLSINLLTRHKGNFKFVNAEAIGFKDNISNEKLENYKVSNKEMDDLCTETPYKKSEFISSEKQSKYYFLKPYIPQVANKIDEAFRENVDIAKIAKFAVQAVAAEADNIGHTQYVDAWTMNKTGIPYKEDVSYAD